MDEKYYYQISLYFRFKDAFWGDYLRYVITKILNRNNIVLSSGWEI